MKKTKEEWYARGVVLAERDIARIESKVENASREQILSPFWMLKGWISETLRGLLAPPLFTQMGQGYSDRMKVEIKAARKRRLGLPGY